MKYFKGCLILILFAVALAAVFIVVYSNKMSREVTRENLKPAYSLKAYKNKILERNRMLLNTKLPDSLTQLVKESDSMTLNSMKMSDFLWTEYYINQYAYKIAHFKKINEELNEKYVQYNSDVQEFNSRWATFPSNIFLDSNNLRSYQYMYRIDYGKDNTENMNERKKVDHWIETGEVIE